MLALGCLAGLREGRHATGMMALLLSELSADYGTPTVPGLDAGKTRDLAEAFMAMLPAARRKIR